MIPVQGVQNKSVLVLGMGCSGVASAKALLAGGAKVFCWDDDEAGRLALRDSILMAAADGNVDDDEKAVLLEIIAHLGLPEEALEKLLKWTVDGYNWMQDGYDILNELSE